MFSSFVGPLPHTFLEFRSRIHSLFPTIVDTKLMAEYGSVDPVSAPGIEVLETGLGDLAKELETRHASEDEITITTDSAFSKYSTDGQFHEAAWDAYQTGSCFLHMLPKYVTDSEGTVCGSGLPGIQNFLDYGPINTCWGTAVVFQWCLAPTSPVAVAKATMRGGQLFHVCGFPPKAGNDEVLAPFAKDLGQHSVLWIRDTEAWVEVVPSKGASSSISRANVVAKMTAGGGLVVRDWETFSRSSVAVNGDGNGDDSAVVQADTSNISWFGWLLGATNVAEKRKAQVENESPSPKNSRKRRRVE